MLKRVGFGVLLATIFLSQAHAQIRQKYDSSQLERWLDGLNDDQRWALVRQLGWGDSVKVGNTWHTRFYLPVEKVWNESDTVKRVIVPTDTVEAAWWTTGGKDLFPVIQDTTVLDPDTLRYYEIIYSKKQKRLKVAVKNGRKGIIAVKGIPSRLRAEKHWKRAVSKRKGKKNAKAPK